MRSSHRRRPETWVRFDNWSNGTRSEPSPVALTLVRDENDARDIVQDAFTRASTKSQLANFQGSSSFFVWLYRIITNLSIDLKRAKPGRQNGRPPTSQRLAARKTNAETDFSDPRPSRTGNDPADVVRHR